MVLDQLRDDLPFAVFAPAGNFLIFNLALQNVIATGEVSYAQYVLPVVVIQASLLGVLTTVDRAARDQQSGFSTRLRTFPISAATPVVARMMYCLIRGALALLAALAVGYAFGFRMTGGLLYSGAFAALVLLFTLALSLGADAAGTAVADAAIGRNGGASQLLLIPQMLLVLLSTGMAPADAFPGWLHSFVVYQPVSQVTETLRDFATGQVAINNLVTSLAWCFGMLGIFGVIAGRVQSRTQ